MMNTNGLISRRLFLKQSGSTGLGLASVASLGLAPFGLLGADAISTDAMVNLAALKRDHPQLVTMGNISTFMLEFGGPARIAARTKVLVRDGVDIISPACGLSTATTLANIRAITDTVSLAAPTPARSGSLR